MEEVFNILEFLRYAPYGLELYSPICGKIYLSEVNDTEIIVNYFSYDKKQQRVTHELIFDSEGRYFDYGSGECMLFPSEDVRDWRFAPKILFPKSVGSVVFFGTEMSAVCGKEELYRMRYEEKYPDVHYDCFDWNDYFGETRYATPDEYNDFFVLLENAGYKLNNEGVLESTWEPRAGDIVSPKDNSSQLYHLLKNEDGFGFNYVITSANEQCGAVGGGGPISSEEIRKRFRLVSRLETPEEYIKKYFKNILPEDKLETSSDEIDVDEMVKTYKETISQNIHSLLVMTFVDAITAAYRYGVLDTIKKYGELHPSN